MKTQDARSLHSLERLSRLGDYGVRKGQVDPGGWSGVNNAGHKVGEVQNLMIDTDRMVATYLDVELDSDVFEPHDDPRVLVPVERARRDGDHKRLVVTELDAATVAEMCIARQRHCAEFWNRWWHRDESSHTAGSTAGTRSLDRADVVRAIEFAKPDVRPAIWHPSFADRLTRAEGILTTLRQLRRRATTRPIPIPAASTATNHTNHGISPSSAFSGGCPSTP